MPGELQSALVGGVIGSGLTGVLTFGRDWWRGRSESEAAKIVLDSELQDAQLELEELSGRTRWPIARHKTYLVTWVTHRGSLVNRLERDDFDLVAKAFARMSQLEDGLAAGERDFVDTDPTFFAQAHEAVVAARPLLGAPS